MSTQKPPICGCTRLVSWPVTCCGKTEVHAELDRRANKTEVQTISTKCRKQTSNRRYLLMDWCHQNDLSIANTIPCRDDIEAWLLLPDQIYRILQEAKEEDE